MPQIRSLKLETQLNYKTNTRLCVLFDYSASQTRTFFTLLSADKAAATDTHLIQSNLCHVQNTLGLALTHTHTHSTRIATQGSLFGQFPGNSVISARPEMNIREGGQLGLRGAEPRQEKMIGMGWWPPAEAVWHRISLIPPQSNAPFL